jgi:hypothetical protein
VAPSRLRTSKGLDREPLVEDSQLSPLDLAIAPNGNIVVSCEWPFGARDAISSVREYDSTSGRLVRIFSPDGSIPFHNPRGLRFSPDGDLYCVGRDEVVSFDFETGEFSGAVVKCSNLFGQHSNSSADRQLWPASESRPTPGRSDAPKVGVRRQGLAVAL